MKGPLWMRLLPKRAFSRAVGRLVNVPLPQPLARWSVSCFARHYAIDLSEAELPITEYRTIGDFFTRKLKAGLRPVGRGVVHPADSVINAAGRVEQGQLLQAKGLTYSLETLLGGAPDWRRFEGGSYVTYYLCPTDYHRVHSPVDGRVTWTRRIPGALWPVNPAAVAGRHGLFAGNERVAALIETEKGRAGFVMVAATGVSDMTISFAAGSTVARGEEIGIFHMGSTVIMLYEKGALPVDPAPLLGKRVRVGQSFEA